MENAYKTSRSTDHTAYSGAGERDRYLYTREGDGGRSSAADEWDDDFDELPAVDRAREYDDGFDDDFEDIQADVPATSRRQTPTGVSAKRHGYAAEADRNRPRADRRPPDAPAARLAPPMRLALGIALAAMAVASVFLFSSGTMIFGSSADNTKNLKDDMAATVYNLKSDSLMAADIAALGKIYYIPWSSTASATDPTRITRVQSATHSDRESKEYPYEELYYEDETIKVHYWRERLMINKMMMCTVHFSEVEISHPTQLRTAFAGGEYCDMASRAEEYPVEMAKDANAVIAVNGDYYNYRETGVLIRNNVGYRFKPYGKYSWDVLLIDDEGNFHIQSDKKINLTRLKNEKIYVEKGVEYNIVNTLHFGPSLVVNGEYRVISKSSGCGSEFNFEEGRSRTAIGQLGELHYLLCVVEDTPVSPASYGTTIDELGKLMLERGCTQAYALDGGQSSVMIFDGDALNNIYRGDARKLTDLVYFASALPAGE